MKESYSRTWYVVNLCNIILLVKFAVCWRYLWCVCTHGINMCFEISNILKSFVIFVEWNYQSIINFSHSYDTFNTFSNFFRTSPNVYTYRKFNPKMDKIRDFFFSKIRTLFSIFKKWQGRPPPLPLPPSCVPDMICKQDMHC